MLTGNEPVSAANLKAVLEATGTKVVSLTCGGSVKTSESTNKFVDLKEDVNAGGFVVSEGSLCVPKAGLYEISGEFAGSGYYESSTFKPSDYLFRVMVDDRVVHSAEYASSWGTRRVNYKLDDTFAGVSEVISPDSRIRVCVYSLYPAPSISLSVNGRMTVVSK